MKEEKTETNLGSISRLTILSQAEPEIFYICQPSSTQQRTIPSTQKQNNNPAQQNTKAMTLPAASGSKWSTDDH